MNNPTTAVQPLVSPLGLLGVAFVVLKLCNVIAWSWWWVTCPFWGGVVLALAIAAAVFAMIALIAVFGVIMRLATRRR